jgi:MYXO-CTERM domain-containing protein
MSGNEYDERPGGRIRIGDKEREYAVQRLGAHYEAGRLTAEEHTERIGEALQAKTEADLAALFADLPGEGRAAGPAAEEPDPSAPWAWGIGAPWTAPQEGREGQGGRGPGNRGPWGAGGPPWAQGRKGPLSRIPLPVLVALAVAGVLISIACVVGGGHPPVLPLLLIVAGILVFRRRRQERRA